MILDKTLNKCIFFQQYIHIDTHTVIFFLLPKDTYIIMSADRISHYHKRYVLYISLQCFFQRTWRKNRAPTSGPCRGIDLNRNYNWDWCGNKHYFLFFH